MNANRSKQDGFCHCLDLTNVCICILWICQLKLGIFTHSNEQIVFSLKVISNKNWKLNLEMHAGITSYLISSFGIHSGISVVYQPLKSVPWNTLVGDRSTPSLLIWTHKKSDVLKCFLRHQSDSHVTRKFADDWWFRKMREERSYTPEVSGSTLLLPSYWSCSHFQTRVL